MKDSTKYAILGLLAVGLIVNGVYLFSKNNYSSKSGKSSIIKTEAAASSNTSAATNNSTTAAQTSLDAQNNATTSTPEASTSAGLPKTSLSWSDTEFDFGDIKQDSENTHIFKFTNTGSEPLIIEKAKGSCGCTVPEYPKEPIPPGGSDEIKVVYKPGKQKNKQTKKVTVTANTDPVQTILTITADVEVPPEAETVTP